MKRSIFILLATLAMAACSRPDNILHGERVLCATNGSAWVAIEGPGITSFVKRSPDADQICRPLAAGSKS